MLYFFLKMLYFYMCITEEIYFPLSFLGIPEDKKVRCVLFWRTEHTQIVPPPAYPKGCRLEKHCEIVIQPLRTLYITFDLCIQSIFLLFFRRDTWGQEGPLCFILENWTHTRSTWIILRCQFFFSKKKEYDLWPLYSIYSLFCFCRDPRG